MEQVQSLLNEVNSKIQSLETAKSLYGEVIQSSNDTELIDVAERSLKRLTPTAPVIDKKD